LGLTALAGSLVATSVSAADLSVTGSWSWSWDSADSDEGGNPMSMGDSITFAISGETDQGWGATGSWELDGGNFDDQKLQIDFGDGGVLQYSTGTGSRGVGLVSDLVPNADTPVYSATDSGGTEYGVARNASNVSNISHQITVGDIQVGAEIHKGAGSSTSWGIKYSGIDNLTIGLGTSDVSPGLANGGSDSRTAGVSYAMGGITIGYQFTEVDLSASDEDATMYGASFAVNDDLTISYGRQTVEIQGAANDEINSGFSASYTMGSMSIGAYVNKTENMAGASANDDEGKGVTVSLSF
jgi:outer membrane protein OmpU